MFLFTRNIKFIASGQLTDSTMYKKYLREFEVGSHQKCIEILKHLGGDKDAELSDWSCRQGFHSQGIVVREENVLCGL
jgi:hypothetical protein